ncbi:MULTISPECIES: hypothetical protein [Methanobacterium]|uniref:hypothetical protein n=1 Tax=Methanobacterium TaxID=2160 RepID=UPI0015B5F42D|nr:MULTISPECIES: hypothetical protein [Methanobacterium]
MKFVVYNDENIKRNNEIMEHNAKVIAKIVQPVLEEIVKNTNESLKQLYLINYTQR